MAKKDTDKLIVEIEVDLHKDFKKLCIDGETDMSTVIRHCINSWVKEQKKNIVY